MRFGRPRLLAAIASLVVLAACGGSTAPTSGGNVSLKWTPPGGAEDVIPSGMVAPDGQTGL